MDAGAFQQFFGIFPEPILLLAPSGEILACNHHLYDLLDYPRGKKLPGASIHSLVTNPPETVTRFINVCRRTREMLPGALTCKTASGTEVPCRAEGALLTAATDTKAAVVLLRLFPKQAGHSKFLVLNQRIDALNREILERRQTQAQLHAEREWLRTTLASIGDGVIATDPQGRITFMNGVAESLTGWTQADAAGQPLHSVFRIVNEYTRETVNNPVLDVLRSGRIVGLANHTVLIARDGTERSIADSGAPICDQSNRIIGVVLVFRDVTESHRNQMLLLQSEQRLRRIFDTAGAAIWEQDFSGVKRELVRLQQQDSTADLESYFSANPEFLRQLLEQVRTVDVNPTAMELFAATEKDQLLGAMPHVFVQESLPVFAEALLAIAAGRNTFQSEMPLVNLNGKPLQVLFTMSFPPDNPELSSVLVSVMDITDRKQAEQALARANEALRRTNSDLEHFAYAAAHDLQEPLRNVILHTQILRRRYASSLDEDAREACRVSEEGARQMQSLVQGLLDYTRVVSDSEVHADRNSVSALDCSHVLASVKANLRMAIDDANARISCDELPVVRARDTHLIQLFQNLLSNAIKYKKPGQIPEIHITVRQEQGQWVFLVRDNGIGIRPEYQQKIFEAFKRLHGREIPGVGMGLTICNRIVAHYGGRMWVNSEEGCGSTFGFTLPHHNG